MAKYLQEELLNWLNLDQLDDNTKTADNVICDNYSDLKKLSREEHIDTDNLKQLRNFLQNDLVDSQSNQSEEPFIGIRCGIVG